MVFNALFSWFASQSITKLIILGALLRALVIIYSHFHDSYFRVKYTDIDYMIITDGAAEMSAGGSPFSRATFRYTPLLAILMMPNSIYLGAGKVVFCFCDIGCSWYAFNILTQYVSPSSAKKAICSFILFNPVVINVSTRGNSDMIITLLSLSVVDKFFKRRYYAAALWLGFAIHFKMYPIIYAAPLVFGLWETHQASCPSSSSGNPNTHRNSLSSRKYQDLWNFLRKVISCGVLTIISFAVPTFLCYMWYRDEYLYEAIYYHLIREDHRHNFSPYFYHMYLNMGRSKLAMDTGAVSQKSIYDSNIIAFIPQVIMLIYVAWKLRRNIAHACCIQTILFVAFNKVCTVQYFVWFIPFLAFIFADFFGVKKFSSSSNGKGNAVERKLRPILDRLTSGSVIIGMSVFWFSSIVVWMATAIQLEFNGHQYFRQVWLASAYFFICQITIAIWLGRVAIMSQTISLVKNEKLL